MPQLVLLALWRLTLTDPAHDVESTGSAAIATRCLKVEGRRRPVVVSVYAPRQVGEEEWACGWRVTGMRKRKDAYGIDAIQALTLALQAIRQHLDTAKAKYTWLAEPGNHGFEQTIVTVFGMDHARRMAKLVEHETTQFVRNEVKRRRQRRK